MEKKIMRTFEYQRFSPNKRLNDLIEDTNRRYRQLSDNDLSFVSAAGAPMLPNELQENDNDNKRDNP